MDGDGEGRTTAMSATRPSRCCSKYDRSLSFGLSSLGLGLGLALALGVVEEGWYVLGRDDIEWGVRGRGGETLAAL